MVFICSCSTVTVPYSNFRFFLHNLENSHRSQVWQKRTSMSTMQPVKCTWYILAMPPKNISGIFTDFYPRMVKQQTECRIISVCRILLYCTILAFTNAFYLMNIAVNCSCVEFPQKIIEIYFLAIFGNFTLERTRKVGRFLDIVAYFLNIGQSLIHGVSEGSQASSRF